MPGIFDAVYGRNFEEVKRMVNEYPETAHIKDRNGWTPLDFAVSYGNPDMVQFLFEKSGGQLNLDIYCDGKWTPIHSAACYGDVATLKWVFARNIFSLDMLKMKDSLRRTPLDCAIAYSKPEIAQFLFEKGGKPNLEVYCNREHTPVHEAARVGCAGTLRWVFMEKNILSPDVLRIESAIGRRTPLDLAIAFGNLEIAKLLWEMRGRPNLETYCDGRWTSVHHATHCGHIATLK